MNVFRSACLLGVIALTGCGSPPPKTPEAPPSTPATVDKPGPTSPAPSSAPNAWTLPEGPRDSQQPASPALPPIKLDAWAKASKVKGVGPSPAACAAFAKRAPAAAATDLGTALAETDPAKRDAMLLAFEKTETVPGASRVLRAELAPVECGDSIVDPYLTSHPQPGEGGHLLVGLSLAAKLARTALVAPVLKDASDKEKIKKFIQGPLGAWTLEQATAIEQLAVPAAELAGYGRAIVAVEAGMADLRLVDRIRSAPTPASWDKELKSAYEASLDQVLEPRKARGRDAALVGLSDFAADGVREDQRIDRARELLSKLYGGRRINALDGLLLPATAREQSILVRGSRARMRWLAPIATDKPAPALEARARLDMGRTYWRRVDFVEAAHAGVKSSDPEQRLVVAVALALTKGPNGAKEMMLAASPAALNLSHTEALDALANEGGKTAGMAAFDAAYLRSLSPPEGAAAAAHFTDVAARFRKAATLLEDPAMKKKAEERAADAEGAAKVQ